MSNIVNKTSNITDSLRATRVIKTDIANIGVCSGKWRKPLWIVGKVLTKSVNHSKNTIKPLYIVVAST